MITIERMMEATELPEIKNLSFKALEHQDLVNLIMQRSEIIFDQPRSGRIIRAWSAGNEEAVNSLVETRGLELAQRAAAIILLEYRQISDEIEQIAPSTASDIGCGYAFFDLFLWRDHKCDLTLIDLETSDERHFGFGETGAAYSNLGVAKSFLVSNGVNPENITCLNPEKDSLSSSPRCDLAMSFISCGFHYPANTYDGFFRQIVSDDGSIILDLRTRKLREGLEYLETLGQATPLFDAARGSAKRVLVKKG